LPLPRVGIADIDEVVVSDFCAKAINKGRLDESASSESIETIIDKMRSAMANTSQTPPYSIPKSLEH
jgi:hypothetical protein